MHLQTILYSNYDDLCANDQNKLVLDRSKLSDVCRHGCNVSWHTHSFKYIGFDMSIKMLI